jgi:hypothetical protein
MGIIIFLRSTAIILSIKFNKIIVFYVFLVFNSIFLNKKCRQPIYYKYIFLFQYSILAVKSSLPLGTTVYDLVDSQYNGKENLFLNYDKLFDIITSLGKDITGATKNIMSILREKAVSKFEMFKLLS